MRRDPPTVHIVRDLENDLANASAAVPRWRTQKAGWPHSEGCNQLGRRSTNGFELRPWLSSMLVPESDV
jgi:hypothetical protein